MKTPGPTYLSRHSSDTSRLDEANWERRASEEGSSLDALKVSMCFRIAHSTNTSPAVVVTQRDKLPKAAVKELQSKYLS